jgi:hypothetical protein
LPQHGLFEVGLATGPAHDRYTATNKWLNVATGQFDSALVINAPPATLH